ncbi:MAG: hypothetical protein AAF670_17940, partial [Planctomycetota bacterium]
GRSPMIRPPKIKYELADRQQAIAAGGIGTLLELTKTLNLRNGCNRWPDMSACQRQGFVVTQ